MFSEFCYGVHFFEDILWVHLGVPTIALLGIYLTYKSRFVQIRRLPHAFRSFWQMFDWEQGERKGVHPLAAFFASVGGCVGIGNIVAVCAAVQLGGPGALFWLWCTAIFGVMVSYAEVYLGVRFRRPNDKGGFDGGPMYYLQHTFKTTWIPMLIAFLLCIYGVEIWQFSIIVHSVSDNLSINPYPIIGLLLVLVLFAGNGGVRRVGAISSAIIPLFLVLYSGMALWVVLQNLASIPGVMMLVLKSAFTGHAATGGFVGSTLMMTISQGVRRASYTGDYGVGYTSVIHAETSLEKPEEQASFVFIGIVLDTFIICSASILLILLTGVWDQPIPQERLIQEALTLYFPYMHFFMPFFLFLLGFSTINAYYVVGLKCAEFLAPQWGRKLYFVYATCALVIFSLADACEAQSVMTVAGGLLLVLNCWGIFRMRKEISYDF